MKIKLLKKIRKRYSIIHYPNGCYISGHFEKEPITILEDKGNSWRWTCSHDTKDKAYAKLYEKLLNWIEKDHGRLRSRRSKVTQERMWWGK